MTEMSTDLSPIGNVTFMRGSSINTVACASVEVMTDNILENVEEFSIFVSNSVTMVEDFEGHNAISSGTLEVDTNDFLLTFPCENATISIATSDTNG